MRNSFVYFPSCDGVSGARLWACRSMQNRVQDTSVMRSIRFSKIRVSEFCKDSGRLGCKVFASGTGVPLGINVAAAMAPKIYSPSFIAAFSIIQSITSKMQALHNTSIFENNNATACLFSAVRPQGETMNLVKREAQCIRASYKGYIPSINEEQGKARCK